MSSTRSSSSLVSTHSSSESISDAGPKTPLDQQLATPSDEPSLVPPNNMALSALYSRLELVPKRSNTAPAVVRANLPVPVHHSTQPTKIRRARDRTVSVSSTTSQASHLSHQSLLRKTLALAISPGLQTPNGSTPSLLTPRSSSSSLASTSLSSQRSTRNSRHNPNLANPSIASRPLDSLSPINFSADPTTALTPTTSTSIAQFSPTPKATSSLLRFGISSTESTVLPSSSNHPSQNHYRTPSVVADDESHRSAFSSFYSGGIPSTMSMIWRGRKSDLPSISRALEPDTPALDSGLTGLDMDTGNTSDRNGSGSLSAKAASPSLQNSPKAIAATPRPTFPINSGSGSMAKTTTTSGSVSAGSHDKHHSEPRRSSTLGTPTPNPRTSSFTSLDKGKGPARLGTMGRASTMDAIATRSIRFDPSVISNDAADKKKCTALPSLAAIESASRLMRARIACVSCGEVGPAYPRCGRCGDAWCSRECRLAANNGGKHRCASSTS